MMYSARSRSVLPLLLVAGLAVAALLLTRDSETYRLHARFENAGQLVRGASVQIAGRKVGSVKAITLTDDGLADVAMAIGDGEDLPFHRGTRATIRALGQAGITSRFVQITPGPRDAPDLDSGAVLPTTQTTGIVDLDQLLNALDGPTKENVRQLVRRGTQVLGDGGDAELRDVLRQLRPASDATTQLAREVAADQDRLRTLVTSSAQVATAVAARRQALDGTLSGAAATLTAVAEERSDLSDAIAQAPRTLERGASTLASARTAVRTLRPTLRRVPATTDPLRDLLVGAAPTLQRLTPQLRRVRADLPPLTKSLRALPGVADAAVPALASARAATADLQPILRGLRVYAPDVILGVFNGLAGVAAANYDATGHYVRLEFQVSPQSAATGVFSGLLPSRPLVPGIFELRTKRDARCPGAVVPPAPDGSTPWVPDPSLCDPSHSLPASVNTP